MGAPYRTIGANISLGTAYVFVTPRCPTVAVAPATLPNGAIGASYNQPLTADGGTSGLQFYPLAHPIRLLETRAGQSGCFTPGAPIAAGTSPGK